MKVPNMEEKQTLVSQQSAGPSPMFGASPQRFSWMLLWHVGNSLSSKAKGVPARSVVKGGV
ncbi:MAG: hypothetical protein ACYC7D_10575 [Nitrososphaerales archaeon]